MMSQTLTRRNLLHATSAAMLGGAWAASGRETQIIASEQVSSQKPGVRYCLNTSTIREAKLSLPQIVDLAADAGYDSVEPWIREIDAYVEQGGRLQDLRKQLEDRNLQVESAIGFPRWSVDDEHDRAAGFEEAKRGMDLVRQLGGGRIAAPPIGMHMSDCPLADLRQLGERYHDLLELGVKMGVVPQIEIWGASRNLSYLAEAVYVAIAANHPAALILPDVYHLYRGGSDFHGLRLLSGVGVQLFHMNDYPAEPARQKQTDADRVYPGDGMAPWDVIIGSLKEIGFQGALSLELFNPSYWKQDPAVVAKTGLQKMKAVVEAHWN